MKFDEARDLRIGEKIKTKNGDNLEVHGLNEFISATTRKKVIYVRCKTEQGNMMEFSHKQLIRL